MSAGVPRDARRSCQVQDPFNASHSSPRRRHGVTLSGACAPERVELASGRRWRWCRVSES